MLTSAIVQKIEQFVHQKPRSIDEISKHIGKNWRTADRYVQEIEKQFGTISTRIFREGTRGSLKIVFFQSIDHASKSIFQVKLEEDILRGRHKEDFSSFDIYQYVADNKKQAYIHHATTENKTALEHMASILESTQKQLLIFSGNLSFVHLKNNEFTILKLLESAATRNVTIKILCHVDLADLDAVERLLALNFKIGREAVEIHHKAQPLRGFISDGKIIRLKEVKEPTGKIGELNTTLFMYYTIKDGDWAQWLSKIFWNMFSSSIDSKKRIDELKKLK